MSEVSYKKIVQRVLDLLQNDETLKASIATFRFGDVPVETDVTAPPAIYVTLPPRVEGPRVLAGPSSSIDVMPAQKIEMSVWIVIIMGGKATAAETQMNMYDLRDHIIGMFSRNIRLLDVDGTDPLVHGMNFDSQDRLSSSRGQTIDGVTIELELTTYKNNAADTS